MRVFFVPEKQKVAINAERISGKHVVSEWKQSATRLLGPRIVVSVLIGIEGEAELGVLVFS